MPTCPHGLRKVACEPAVVELAYPSGTLLAEGFRCPECGEEWFTGEQVDTNQRRATTLGLFGPDRVSRRKLRQVGSSLSVTLDAALLRELMPDVKAGDEVEIGREGKRIVIRAVDDGHART